MKKEESFQDTTSHYSLSAFFIWEERRKDDICFIAVEDSKTTLKYIYNQQVILEETCTADICHQRHQLRWETFSHTC